MKIFIILPLVLSCMFAPFNPQKGIVKSGAHVEYFDWKSVKINHHLSLLCKKSDLVKLLGQPDSTIVPSIDDNCGTYFDDAYKNMYFGKSEFETKGNLAVLRSIHFKNNSNNLSVGNILLDHTMTIVKLAAIFPNAVKLKKEVVLENGEKAISIRLETSKSGGDDAWILIFQNGKLSSVDYWISC